MGADHKGVPIGVQLFTFPVNGQSVGWHVYGPEAGRPLLFLHGWGMLVHGYRRAIEGLAAAGWTIHAMDLPGFGRSAPLPVSRSSLSGYADFLAAALAVSPVAGARVPVVGHSFGAGIAARVAVRHVDLFQALLLVCPVGGAGSSVGSWVALTRAVVTEFSQELAIRATDSVTAVIRHPLPLVRSAYAAKTADLTGELRTLHAGKVPVHLFLADRDSIVPAGQLASAPSTSTTVVRGNHGWMLTRPAEFAVAASQALPAA